MRGAHRSLWREIITFVDVQSAARSISETQNRLFRLRNRFRRSSEKLPDNNREKLFAVAFRAIDQALVEARDRLVVNDLGDCKQYVSTANAMLIGAEDNLDRLLQQNVERHEA